MRICPVTRTPFALTRADDAATATRKLKGDVPGQDREINKAGEEGFEALRAKAQEAGTKLQDWVGCLPCSSAALPPDE